MFEHMEITESIYEEVVTPSYLKTIQEEANPTRIIRNKTVEAFLPNTHPLKYVSAGKRHKRYVDISKSESKTCMLHGAGHSSDECKVLGKFGTKYTAFHTTKGCRINTVPEKIFQVKQENHYILNNMDEIQMTESNKVNAVNNEASEFLESNYNENNLYQVENMSLGETK